MIEMHKHAINLCSVVYPHTLIRAMPYLHNTDVKERSGKKNETATNPIGETKMTTSEKYKYIVNFHVNSRMQKQKHSSIYLVDIYH